MPYTWDREPRIVRCREQGPCEDEDDTRHTQSSATQEAELRPDRIELIRRRIATKRAGASLKVGEKHVRMALAGEHTLHTRCMALSLGEIEEPELKAWIAQGWITAEELRRCQALDPRTR